MIFTTNAATHLEPAHEELLGTAKHARAGAVAANVAAKVGVVIPGRVNHVDGRVLVYTPKASTTMTSTTPHIAHLATHSHTQHTFMPLKLGSSSPTQPLNMTSWGLKLKNAPVVERSTITLSTAANWSTCDRPLREHAHTHTTTHADIRTGT